MLAHDCAVSSGKNVTSTTKDGIELVKLTEYCGSDWDFDWQFFVDIFLFAFQDSRTVTFGLLVFTVLEATFLFHP